MTPAEYLESVKERLLTGLPGFPHHVHDGQYGATLPGQPVDIFIVLDLIQQRIG